MKALATIVVGEKYQNSYEQFKKSHEDYCARHNWKHLVFTEPLDKEGDRKSIIAQKILVGTLEEYETVVWIDSDIFITDESPEIETKDPSKIGVCDQRPYHNDTIYDDVKKHRSWGSNEEYYNKYSLPNEGLSDFNAGIMVFHPKYHAGYLKNLYHGLVKFIEGIPQSDPETGVLLHYEQPYLGHHLFKDEIYETLDWKHNAVWPLYRCLLAEPYGNQFELIRPMKRLIDVTWSVHFTDREDIDILETVKQILNQKGKIMTIHSIQEYLNPLFRLCDYKTVYAPSEVRNTLRFNQTGYVIPRNIVDLSNKDD